MNDYPLLVSKLLEYAERLHPHTEIVSRRLEGDIHRYSYRDFGRRVRQLANALNALGVEANDVVGTLAWNGYRHMELYFALPGIQAIYHTINPRLKPDQLCYIANHAEDKYLFIEVMFVPMIEILKEQLPNVQGFVVLCDEGEMPETSLPNAMCYETLINQQTVEYEWPVFDENEGCGLCYTSGTTGYPKGVLYSHRALVLQAMNTVIGLELTCRDVILPIVPMFHVNAWGMPFVAPMMGIKIVLPGRELGGRSLTSLLNQEEVTFSAGVPTVCQMLLNYLKESGERLSTLRKMCIGGSVAPPSMLEAFLNDYHVEPAQAWGMTETTSMGAAPSVTARVAARGQEEIDKIRATQGRCVFGAELRILDDAGNQVVHDGQTSGHLQIRGWATANSYFKSSKTDEFSEDGWMATGDVATIDEHGYLKIVDRAKDLIKSGGEWISSVQLESAALDHKAVKACAAIGIPHPKWEERPLLLVVKCPDTEVSAEDIIAFLETKVAKLWAPDDIIFCDELPIGSTGKIDKKSLKIKYGDHLIGTEREQ